MLKPVLVPLDGSALAEHALLFATALCQLRAAPLVLLYAHWPVIPVADGPDLRTIADRLRAEGVDVSTHVCHLPSPGEAGAVILHAAADLGAMTIVMGTHGRGGLGRLVHGSVADHVLRHATVPVMLVGPGGVRPWPQDRPLRILVPLDGSELAEAILAPVQELVGVSGTALTLLRVVETEEYDWAHVGECDSCRQARARGAEPETETVKARHDLDAVASRVQDAGFAVSTQTEVGKAPDTIARLATEHGIDLIAMATHGRGGLSRLVMGSVATATLTHAAVPLLVVRPQRAGHSAQESSTATPPR